MKLIHCSELHLDASMASRLGREKARERRAELLHTFERMVSYAGSHDVKGIIIAGDLFDTKKISATAVNTVKAAITANPGLSFYYLRGNHDTGNFPGGPEDTPDNLKLFSDNWITYVLETGGKEIAISGVELNRENTTTVYDAVPMNRDQFHIVVLHGQTSEHAKSGAETIRLRKLRNKGIDYLALGHIHTYQTGTLDSRGSYCYAGCLEGRGFDECGAHGFVLLDIDAESGTFTQTLIPIAERCLYTVESDISGCMTTTEISEKLKQDLAKQDFGQKNLLKIILKGSVDVACEKNLDLLTRKMEDICYFITICDETTVHVDYHTYARDESLKGEFVRLVSGADLEEADKGTIIRYGLQALAGEDFI